MDIILRGSRFKFKFIKKKKKNLDSYSVPIKLDNNELYNE